MRRWWLLLCAFGAASAVPKRGVVEREVKVFKHGRVQVFEETAFSNPNSFDYDFDEDAKKKADKDDLYDESVPRLPDFDVFYRGKNIGTTQEPLVTRKGPAWSTKGPEKPLNMKHWMTTLAPEGIATELTPEPNNEITTSVPPTTTIAKSTTKKPTETTKGLATTKKPSVTTGKSKSSASTPKPKPKTERPLRPLPLQPTDVRVEQHPTEELTFPFVLPSLKPATGRLPSNADPKRVRIEIVQPVPVIVSKKEPLPKVFSLPWTTTTEEPKSLTSIQPVPTRGKPPKFIHWRKLTPTPEPVTFAPAPAAPVTVAVPTFTHAQFQPLPQAPAVFSTAAPPSTQSRAQSFSRLTAAPKPHVIKQEGVHYRDEHDESCAMSMPGFSADGSCMCTYTIENRDENGCATGFLFTCKPRRR